MKNKISFLTLFILLNSILGYSQFSILNWEKNALPSGTIFHEIYFPNADLGFAIATNQSGNTLIYRTENRGLNWYINKNFNNTGASFASFNFQNPGRGIALVIDNGTNKIYKTENGGTNWAWIANGPTGISFPKFKINYGLMYCYNYRGNKIYRYDFDNPANGFILIREFDALTHHITNLKFNNSTGRGYVSGYYNFENVFKPILGFFDDEGSYGEIFAGNIDPQDIRGIYDFDFIPNSTLNTFVGVTTIGTVRGGVNNFYFSSPISLGPGTVNTTPNSNIEITSRNSGSMGDINGGLIRIDNHILGTSNGGLIWQYELMLLNAPFNLQNNDFQTSQDVAYILGDNGTTLYRRRISTNLLTRTDLEESPQSIDILIDGVSYPSLQFHYLRGGSSQLNAPVSLNNGNEIFYKWDMDSIMNPSRSYYFSEIETEITADYKTKQISNNYNALQNVSQTKSLKDNFGAINQIHESIGGIFFSRSYDNGQNFQKEEIVNYIANGNESDGNTHPFINETKPFSTPAVYDKKKNVVACWERFNSANQRTEIRVAARNFDVGGDTSWRRWKLGSNDIFTSFNSSPTFESFPKVFAIATDYVYNLGNPSTYFILIPHLKPSTNGVKVAITARMNSNGDNYREFGLDSGNISEMSVIDSTNTGGYIRLYFAYKKDNQIIYRKAAFTYQSGLPLRQDNLEGPVIVSSGENYLFRSEPDISIMNGIPVISYAARYFTNRLIQFEDGQTQTLPSDFYPIIKVERIDQSTWRNYVIYNSPVNTDQRGPDIEGSKDTKSYLINYRTNFSNFKKVVKVYGHPGYFVEPNTFNGADSRLIRNSYTGYFGSNLSLLTLSQFNSLYKLGKQNFVITNINEVNGDRVDNIDGVANQDEIRYSFNLGPILIQDGIGEVKEINFEDNSDQSQPILTPVEFNQNLRSNTFLLNENQALIIGSNATYVKDNDDAPLSNIQYDVNLINKSTGLIHRILYNDTIQANDSLITEFLRGYYINNIPNGSDSFYVEIKVNEDQIDGEAYSVNPVFNNGDAGGDNSSNYKTKIVFEDSNSPQVTNNVPTEYSLLQNYPNPFNPSTMIKYNIPNPGIVNIKIFDIRGREIKTLINEFNYAGTYSIKFDGSNFASGVYYYRIETKDFIETKKMLLIK